MWLLFPIKPECIIWWWKRSHVAVFDLALPQHTETNELTILCLPAAGLRCSPAEALHWPEGQTVLSYPHPVHELWPSGRHGKNQCFLPVKCWEMCRILLHFHQKWEILVSSRCGKARVRWRQAGPCWVRPTQPTPTLEPSEETSASTSAS